VWQEKLGWYFNYWGSTDFICNYNLEVGALTGGREKERDSGLLAGCNGADYGAWIALTIQIEERNSEITGVWLEDAGIFLQAMNQMVVCLQSRRGNYIPSVPQAGSKRHYFLKQGRCRESLQGNGTPSTFIAMVIQCACDRMEKQWWWHTISSQLENGQAIPLGKEVKLNSVKAPKFYKNIMVEQHMQFLRVF